MSSAEAWKNAQNILCVRLDTLGDVLMTTPAIRALKEFVPGRRVTLLTSPAGAEVARLVPEIDATMIYLAPWMKATAPRQSSAPEYEMAERLRAARFDGAVIFTVYSQNPLPSAFLCYLADIPLRLAHCHENPYQLLTDWVPDPEPVSGVRHEVQRQLDLVATIGCRTARERLSLQFSEGARERAAQWLDTLGVDRQRPWLVIHPGASAPSRRYPPESFAEAVRLLAAESGWQIVFTGDTDERELIEQIRGQIHVSAYSLAGRLDLEELAALLALAPLLISNNTGPAHVAAAVGTPVVDLYALTNPQHTPWQVPCRVLYHDVPCKWCYKSICPQEHHDCLRRVTPQAVATAVNELMREVASHRAGPGGL